MVALYAAVLVSVRYDDFGVGPVELGAAVTTLCVGAVLRTGLSPSLVRIVQRATSLTLLLLTAALWSRQQPWGIAAGALALSLWALWWMEEDERRGATIEESAWRTKLFHEMHVVRLALAATEPRLTPPILRPLLLEPVLTLPPDPTPDLPVRAHHARPARRRGAHRSPVRGAHRPSRSTAADNLPGPRLG